jgi:hypothetical protein
MKAENPISVPENVKFTEENSKIMYKQEQDLKKKTFVKHKLIQKLNEIRGKVYKEWERPQQKMENGKLFY